MAAILSPILSFSTNIHPQIPNSFTIKKLIFFPVLCCRRLRLPVLLMADRGDKSEVVAVAVVPNFAGYRHNDYRSINHGKKESSAVLLKRNKRKHADHDESTALCMALEHVILVNGLECKMASNSSKISYVLDTEDFFFRQGGKRSKFSAGRLSCPNQARVERFHRFLLSSL